MTGFTVRIRFAATSPFGATETTLHNITEIHSNYPSVLGEKRIAFESDIDRTGRTYDMADIAEYEATVVEVTA